MKKIIVLVLVGIALVGGSFYGGMKYTQSYGSAGASFRNLTLEERQQRFQQGGLQGTANRIPRGNGVSGEIMSKDDTSITVKTLDGGSKIVLITSTTQATKSVQTFLADLVPGISVMVNGTNNTDGSITAQSIQIRQFPSSASGSLITPIAPVVSQPQ